MWLLDIFKKRKKKDRDQTLAKVNKQLKSIENILLKINDKSFEYNINIENLNINNPQLDNLTFHLDSLDIKELGGALNLGNNFGVRVVQEEKDKKKTGKNSINRKNFKKNYIKTNNLHINDKKK